MTEPSEFDPTTRAQPPRQEHPQIQSQPVGYEFTIAQSESIRVLSRRMKFVGIFYIVASLLMGLAGLVALFIAPLMGVLYLILLVPQLLIGIWTISAAQSFKLIVDTEGRDIPHLMVALTALRKLYTLMLWLFIAAIVLIVLAVAAGVLLWATGIIPGTHDGSTYTALMF
jgi:hypothetical protein